eukprot:3200041-Amphidinium_carterae.1
MDSADYSRFPKRHCIGKWGERGKILLGLVLGPIPIVRLGLDMPAAGWCGGAVALRRPCEWSGASSCPTC